MARHSRIEALRTKQELLRAAAAVFARQGVSNTCLEEIAREAGVTRGAIYVHFRGKDDLLQTLLDQELLPLERELSARLDLRAGWQRMQRAVDEVLRNKMLRQLCTILLHKSERVNATSPTTHRLHQLAERFSCEAEKLLTRAVAAGQLRADLDVAAASNMVRTYVCGLVFEGLLFSGNAARVAPTLETLLEILRNPPPSLLGAKPAVELHAAAA